METYRCVVKDDDAVSLIVAYVMAANQLRARELARRLVTDPNRQQVVQVRKARTSSNQPRP